MHTTITDNTETILTSISTSAITLSSNTNTQTSYQIGYYINYVRVLTNASVSNGSILSAEYCSYLLSDDFYMVQIYCYFQAQQ